MIALHAELRRRGVPTYIFSNTNDLAIEHIRKKFPVLPEFRRLHLFLRSRRDETGPKIYEALEKLSGRHGADILYLDDRPENVAGGAARGWQAILHETPEKTRAAVEKYQL